MNLKHKSETDASKGGAKVLSFYIFIHLIILYLLNYVIFLKYFNIFRQYI